MYTRFGNYMAIKIFVLEVLFTLMFQREKKLLKMDRQFRRGHTKMFMGY